MKCDESVKCDRCGQFIKFDDMVSGDAIRVLVTPDSDLSEETYETLCKNCNKQGE